MIFERQSRLLYLKKALNTNDVSNLKILDYGGNRGNLLEDGIISNEIIEENYTCLDVSNDALEYGNTRFPNSNWIKHNSLNWEYNPTGIPFQKFPLDSNSFDIVFGYSVHTHCSYEMFKHDLEESLRVLKEGGIFITSLFTNTIMPRIIKNLKLGNPHLNLNDTFFNNNSDFLYFINGNKIVKDWNLPCKSFITIYNENWLKNQINYDLEIKNDIFRKTNYPFQSALIIKK